MDDTRGVTRPEHCQPLLAVNGCYNRRGRLRDDLGQLIHGAVVDSGVRTMEDYALAKCVKFTLIAVQPLVK